MKFNDSMRIMSAVVLIGMIGQIGVSFGVQWWEETGFQHSYKLTDMKILFLLGNDFDYKEMIIVKTYLEKWGAKVELAGIGNDLEGYIWKMTEKGFDNSERVIIQPNTLLTDANLENYKAIFIPGGEAPASLIAKVGDQLDLFIQEANKRGIVLAASAQGPIILAHAGVINGKTITGKYELKSDFEKSGAKYVYKVGVVSGNIVTGNWPYFETMAVNIAEGILYPNGGGPSEKSIWEINPVLKNLKERRSIRLFQEKDVDIAYIANLLLAAEWAPSANNMQPWKFVVVRTKETKEKIAALIMQRMTPYFEARQIPVEQMKSYWTSAFSAPVLIFAFYDPGTIQQEEQFKDVQMMWGIEAVSAACQNILLAAESLNLGSLWVGTSLVVEDDIKALLEVPKDAKLVTTIAIGYKGHEALPPVRKTFTDVVFSEKWGAY